MLKQQGETGPEGAETVWEKENNSGKTDESTQASTSAQTLQFYLKTCSAFCLRPGADRQVGKVWGSPLGSSFNMSAVLGSNVTGKYAIQHLEIATVDLMPSKWQQKTAGRHKFAYWQICLYRQSTTCICSTAPQKSPVHMHAVCVCIQRLFVSVCKDVACFASPGSNQDVCFSNCRETT